MQYLKQFCENVLLPLDQQNIQTHLRFTNDKKLNILKEYYFTERHSLKFTVLIPDILELYFWIHNKLKFLLSEEEAQITEISQEIKKYTEKVDEKEGKKIERVYKRLFKNWNDYLDFTGGMIGIGT